MDKGKVINGLEMCTKPTPSYCRQCPYRNIPDDYPHCVHKRLQQDALALLKEQDAEIRQLRLALDIVKGTCKGIVVEGGEVK